MKKIVALLISLLLCSGLFAKQYIYSLKTNAKLITCSCSSSQKLQKDLERVLFDLLLRGNKIVLITPTTADGYTIGYTIIYEDSK